MKLTPAPRTPRRAVSAIVLASTGIAVMLIGNLPMLSSDLGPIDDHEIITWRGHDGGVTVSRIPTILLTTEVGGFGATTRFRPVGYGFRVLEAWIFGDTVAAWFLTRSILLGLAAAGLALGSLALLDRALDTLSVTSNRGIRTVARWFLPVLFLTLLQGLEVWGGIATRLGPTENFAAMLLGIGIGILTLVAWSRELTTRRAGLLLLGVAAAFALLVLTKETLVSLSPLVVVAGLSLRRHASRAALAGAAAVAASGPVLVILAVGPTVGGGDVYGRGFGLGRLYATAFVWIRSPWLAGVFLAALAAAVLLDQRAMRAGTGLRWWVLASGVAQVIDMFGHAGEARLRYRLVLDLGASFQMAVVMVAATVLFIEYLERCRRDPLTRRWAAVVGAGVIGFAALWGGFAVSDRYGNASRRAVLVENFNDAVAAAADTVGAEGLVILVVEDPDHREWGVAAEVFLWYRHGGISSVLATREDGGSVTFAEPTVEPRSATVGPFDGLDAIGVVPTTCLYLRRTVAEPVDLCIGLPEVTHHR